MWRPLFKFCYVKFSYAPKVLIWFSLCRQYTVNVPHSQRRTHDLRLYSWKMNLHKHTYTRIRHSTHISTQNTRVRIYDHLNYLFYYQSNYFAFACTGDKMLHTQNAETSTNIWTKIHDRVLLTMTPSTLMTVAPAIIAREKKKPKQHHRISFAHMTIISVSVCSALVND